MKLTFPKLQSSLGTSGRNLLTPHLRYSHLLILVTLLIEHRITIEGSIHRSCKGIERMKMEFLKWPVCTALKKTNILIVFLPIITINKVQLRKPPKTDLSRRCPVCKIWFKNRKGFSNSSKLKIKLSNFLNNKPSSSKASLIRSLVNYFPVGIKLRTSIKRQTLRFSL